MYRDRSHAGKVLAGALARMPAEAPLVLALPRGGVPVGYEISRRFGYPLDVFLVRKLGLPGWEELAMGAIATGGVRVLNDEVIESYRVEDRALERVTAMERRELERRERLYRSGLPPHDVRGREVILVDDGLATGSSMKAAILALRERGPSRIVVAVPVSPVETRDEVGQLADEVVCPLTPRNFQGVGQYYQDFGQTSDDEVCRLLSRARQPSKAAATR